MRRSLSTRVRLLTLAVACSGSGVHAQAPYSGPLFDAHLHYSDNQRWQHYEARMDEARQWLGELPPATARRIAWDNGARLFGLANLK